MDNIQSIIIDLNKRFDELFNWLDQQETDQFSVSPIVGKWSTGQHIEHLIISTRAVRKGIQLPKFQLKLMFGKPNRGARTYDEVVKKYKSKLAEGPVFNKQFAPKGISNNQKTAKIAELKTEQKKLETAINKWSETDLDKYLLPHPLLGKMLVREMLCFTIYHTFHHFSILETKY